MSFDIVVPYGSRTYKRNPTVYFLRWAFSVAQHGSDGVTTIADETVELFTLLNGKSHTVFQAGISRLESRSPKVTYYLAPQEEIGRDLFSELGRLAPGNKVEAYAHISDKVQQLLRDLRRSSDVTLLRPLSSLDLTMQQLLRAIENLSEYDIHPNTAREATDQLPTAEMLPNGKNLTEVIHALEKKNFIRIRPTRSSEYESGYPPSLRNTGWQTSMTYPYGAYRTQKERESTLDNINSELSAAVQLIDRVTVDVDRSNGKRITMFESGKDRFYPEEVSDGTMKWLGILVSLFVPFSSIYLLEEPENFLHPWMQQRLIQLMRGKDRPRQRYFVLTTHSATMLNAAQPEEVVLVSPSASGTVVEHVSAMAEVVGILNRSDFGLGDLWVSGALGGVPAGEAV
ncbi:MAG TPA: ATP-binding protein [Longimicrobium sp.]|jgi:hypothetical protein